MQEKTNNPCATPYVYPSLPFTNTSCQRHLTLITLRCALTPSNAINSEWETSWYVTVQLYPFVWLSMVRRGESLNAECTYLDCWKLFFFFLHYSMLYCPVLIVKGVVLDRHCVCSRAWLQEMFKTNKKKKLKLKAFLPFCLHLVVLRASLPWHSLNIENVNICLRKVLNGVEKN